MKVLVTGADGFIARNLRLRMREAGSFEVATFARTDDVAQLPDRLQGVQAVVHLAGVNRAPHPEEFQTGNADLTAQLCVALKASSRPIAVLFASSTQAQKDSPYGRSKLAAEEALQAYASSSGAPVVSYRLPNIFGKWSRPNYNSAVATFCHNIARGLTIDVHNPDAEITLVYVDDVCTELLDVLNCIHEGRPLGQRTIAPAYSLTVGELAAHIERFRDSRLTLSTERVGTGLLRALYSTYVSFLPMKSVSYRVPRHVDARGAFVEMLKTPDAGQFSFFTAHPGVTRGGHYHHTKTEKFLVIQGQANFRFRHMVTGEFHELVTTGDTPEIVETVPGWAHDITNVGDQDLIVMLWANELFDRAHPDTYSQPL